MWREVSLGAGSSKSRDVCMSHLRVVGTYGGQSDRFRHTHDTFSFLQLRDAHAHLT